MRECVAGTSHVTGLTQNTLTLLLCYQNTWASNCPVIHTGVPCRRKPGTYRSFLSRGPSRYEDVYEILLWEDQPASPSSLLH